MTQSASIYRDDMRPKARKGSTSTSVAAAIDATPKAPTMTDEIWALYEDGPASPEEIHARMIEREPGRRVLLTSVRARICGLHRCGRLKDSGQRGLGESLRSRVVKWERTTAQEYADYVAREAVKTEDAAND